MLVVDVDALSPIDRLGLVDEVFLQRLLAEHVQDLVRVERAVRQRIPSPDPFPFLHVDSDTARNVVLARDPVVGGHSDLAVRLLEFAV